MVDTLVELLVTCVSISQPPPTSDTRAILELTWVVVTIRVPFWVLNMIRHLIFRVPKKGL